jgi:hypothetical protein
MISGASNSSLVPLVSKTQQMVKTRSLMQRTARSPNRLGLFVGAIALSGVALLTGCGASKSDGAARASVKPSLSTSTVHPTKPAHKYPDPVAWGRRSIKQMHATGRWEFDNATIAWPNTDHAQLDVSTPYYDKDENRESGPASGLCLMFTEYAQAYRLTRVVIHASNSAPLVSVESRETETWSTITPAWTCHRAG